MVEQHSVLQASVQLVNYMAQALCWCMWTLAWAARRAATEAASQPPTAPVVWSLGDVSSGAALEQRTHPNVRCAAQYLLP